MRICEVDTRSLLNSIPYPAMLLDSNHKIIDANTLMAREAECDGACLDCFSVVHHAEEPVHDCPLVESVATGKLEVSVINDEARGRIRVAVSPLDATRDTGERVYLHVMSAD